MNKSLHIVSFDYPFPPYYGGIIDVFYKIKALNALGVEIHLHYFSDSIYQHQELEELCHTITPYPKSSVLSSSIFSKIPLRMLVRRSSELTKNLAKNDFPILYEGLQSSYSSLHADLKKNKKFLRCHNAEANYARELAQSENNLLKKIIFSTEALITSRFEKKLHQFDGLFVLSEDDKKYFNRSNEKIKIVPIFHGQEEIEVREGLGDYVLFHGNLTVAENVVTAKWIFTEIAPELPHLKFILAGKSLDGNILNQYPSKNVECVFNPNQQQMKNLIQNAQIVLLKTMVPSGIKLKLIDSLAQARHIISDFNSVEKSGMSHYVSLASTTNDFLKKIEELMYQEVDKTQIQKRAEVFNQAFNNKVNAKKIVEELF